MKQPLALFQGFHFILLSQHTKCPQVPSIVPAFFPSHISLSIPSPLFLLLLVKIEATERTEWFQVETIRRRQSQDMPWGHLWYSTWNRVEVVPAVDRGLRPRAEGGSQALISLHLTVLLALQRLTQVFVSFNSSLAYESLKLKWVISESNWSWIQFLPKETGGNSFGSLVTGFWRIKSLACLWLLGEYFLPPSKQRNTHPRKP